MTLPRPLELAKLMLVLCACAAPRAPLQAPSQPHPADVTREETESPRSPMAASTGSRPSLFQRLGGLPAIEAVVADFRRNVNEDERVNATFALSDMELLNRHLVEYFCEVTGGPCKYSGRDMRTTHKGMGISNAQFDAVVEDLVKTLDKFKVPGPEKSEVLGALAPLRSRMVEE